MDIAHQPEEEDIIKQEADQDVFLAFSEAKKLNSIKKYDNYFTLSLYLLFLHLQIQKSHFVFLYLFLPIFT